jgi:hypothetical protein
LADLLFSKFYETPMLEWTVDVIARSSNSYIVRQAAMKLANNENLPPDIIERIRVIMKDVIEKNKGEMNYPISSALATVVKQKIEDDNW